MKGKLIVIEGLDGSGKSTQIELLKKKLDEKSKTYCQIKLPDYGSESSALVRMYLAGEFGSNPQDVNAYASSSFYAVDRVANYICKWRESYLGGQLIIADRYTTSNAYHQMQKLLPERWDEYLEWLSDFEYDKLCIPKPDLVIYLDMPVDVSQKLMSKRYSGDEGKKDIHEVNVSYLTSCRTAALYAADKLGWNVIKCSENGNPLEREEIGNIIYDIISEDILINA